MTAGYYINITSSVLLQANHNICQLMFGDLFAHTTMTQLIILTAGTLERTARKEKRA